MDHGLPPPPPPVTKENPTLVLFVRAASKFLLSARSMYRIAPTSSRVRPLKKLPTLNPEKASATPATGSKRPKSRGSTGAFIMTDLVIPSRIATYRSEEHTSEL